MLQIYSMRWSIEVYYKEAKQHLGFLKEQSHHYAAYVAPFISLRSGFACW